MQAILDTIVLYTGGGGLQIARVEFQGASILAWVYNIFWNAGVANLRWKINSNY
jgi:hypothetical protein